MKVATWNVNSIRARMDRLLRWLAAHQPDVLCLQELKVSDADFPFAALREAGYHAAAHGQKTYNGVAILSRTEPVEVESGLGDGIEDSHARLIAASIPVPGAAPSTGQGTASGTRQAAGAGSVRVVSVYAPNGQVVGSDKWAYKLEWLRRLRAYLDRKCAPGQPLVVCGDFNVAPEPRDVHDPAAWETTVLFHPEARKALETVTTWGLIDTLRLHHEEGGLYSWWDYRMLAFPRNNGLRIDFVFASEPLARRCAAASIDRQERKGPQPSDHVPVVAEFRGA